MTIARGYDGICTNTMTFSSLEGLRGEVSVSFNVIGAITSTITPETGGELIYSGDNSILAEITAPAGAVSETTTLSYVPQSDPGDQPADMLFAGQAFDLSVYRDGELLEDFTFEAGRPRPLMLATDSNGLVSRLSETSKFGVYPGTCMSGFIRRQTQVFILRLWAEYLEKLGAPLHGEIEHVGSRQVVRFADTERMLDFIEATVSSRDEVDLKPDGGSDQAL